MMVDDSSYWVGPVGDPNRFRLTHLLGSGGEGEVWRAVRAGHEDTEVAIKVNRAVGDGGAGNGRLKALVGMRLDGLVLLHDVFSGPERHRQDEAAVRVSTHDYLVMDFVDGITLRTWLDENPGASARARIRMLRHLAKTLSGLHRGPHGSPAVTHGDVKPANVIVRPDGRPVLVDFGLLRTIGSGPASGRSAAYSSPELRNPDAVPSARADTFSFAVTAMETLTGLVPPLGPDGSLDLDATRTRIAAISSLRLRPVLRRQLLRSLTEEPQNRPQTPVRVFAGRAGALVLAPVLALTAGGGTAIALQPASNVTPRSHGRDDTIVSPPIPGTTLTSRPSPTGQRTPKKHPSKPIPGSLLNVKFGEMDQVSQLFQPVWPSCRNTRSNITADRSSRFQVWGGPAEFTADLQASRDIEIREVVPASRPADGPAVLRQQLSTYCPEPGDVPPIVSPPELPNAQGDDCHPEKLPLRPTARFAANIDKHSFTEIHDKDKRPFGVSTDKCALPTGLSLRLTNCTSNVVYGLTFRYVLFGTDSPIYEQTFYGPEFWVRGNHATFITSLFGVRSTYRFHNFSGVVAGCGKPTQPYGSLDREVNQLLVQAVNDLRHTSTMTRSAAIGRVARQAGTTVEKVTKLCNQAFSLKFRSNCGPKDPTVAPTPSPTATPQVAG